MRRFKCFIDYTKEEKWLREMANEGYFFVGYDIGYKFKKVEREDVVYKIDFRIFKSQKDFIDYCTIFEDAGWKLIYGGKSKGNQYFVKISKDSNEEIFSDNISKAARYNRLSNMWLSIATAYLPLSVILFSTNSKYIIEALTNPKNLYYTPGLWETTGVEFLGKFLFETPFVIMRGFFSFILIFLIIIYLYFSYKSKKLYKLTIADE